VVAAAEAAGVRRIALLSFLRARPACGSPYHESKWAAEEIVRASSLDWTVLKPGVIYGRGDHMLDHIAAALGTLPVFVRLGRAQVRPLAVADLVRVLVAALVDGRLARRTIPLTGPTQVSLDQLTAVIAEATGRRPRVLLPVPVSPLYYLPAWLAERVMTVPVLSMAQVRILIEGAVEPVLAPDDLPADLTPVTPYDAASVRAGLPPEPARFSRADLRVCAG
jgi:NADH dehydrogenase